MNEQIPISPGDGRLDRVRTDPEFHRAAFQLRGWNATTGAQLAGLTYQTVSDILGRQSRRDKDGLVAIDLKTLFALKTAYAKYRPIYIITMPRQGPPVRRKLEDKMRGAMFPEDRLRAHEALEEAREADRMERVKRARQEPR